MKEKVFGWLFRKELTDLAINQRAFIYEKKNFEKEKLEEINQSQERLLQIKAIVKGQPHLSIVGFEKNKFDEVIVVREERNSMINFFLRSDKHKGIDSNPRLYSYHKEKNSIWIEDFFAVEEGVGNAKILMKYLHQYAATKPNVTRLHGMLPRNGDIEGLAKFYPKMGFEVKLNNDRSGGSINKLLKSGVNEFDEFQEKREKEKLEKSRPSMLELER